MMVNVLKKYFSRWHPTPKRWRTSEMLLLLEGVEDKRLDVLIMSPRAVCDFLKAKGVEHKINPSTFFFLWKMEKKKAKGGGMEYTMIITDIPNTLDPETFIPTKTLPRNGFRSQQDLSKTILKSVYISETNDTVVSPFTQVEYRK